MTDLSRPNREGESIGATRGVARRWLGVAPMLLLIATTSCIVAPPTPYEDSEQTPPLLITVQAVPPITDFVRIPERSEPEVQHFSVPVQSEDAGDRLIGVLVASYGQVNEETASPAAVLEPGNFVDGPREMQVTWPYDRYERGCYQLSLVVTHESNFDLVTYRPRPEADDVAIATWWVNLEAGDESIASCASAPAQGPI